MAIDTGDSAGTETGIADPRASLWRMIHATAAAAGRAWPRLEGPVGVIALWGFAATVLAIAWLRPVYDWDMIAYLAVAFSGAFASAAELHAHVWGLIQAGVEPDQFAVLSEGDGYRVRQFTDPDAFVSMLGMYEVKWLYVKLLAAIVPITGAMTAPLAINAGAMALLFGVLTWWMAARRLLGFAPLVVAAMMAAQFPALAMAETPDLLTCAFVLAGFLLLDRDHPIAGFGALVLAVATRPDSAAVVGVLMAAAWLWRDRMVTHSVAAFVLAVAVYLGVSWTSTHPGWWAHVWFSIYHIQDTLEGFSPDFSVRVYAIGFAWNLVRAAFENTWLGLYAAALVAAAVVYARGWRLEDRRAMLIAAALIAVAAKYVVFPLHDGRTFIPLLLPVLLLFLAEARRLGTTPENAARA